METLGGLLGGLGLLGVVADPTTGEVLRPDPNPVAFASSAVGS